MNSTCSAREARLCGFFASIACSAASKSNAMSSSTSVSTCARFPDFDVTSCLRLTARGMTGIEVSLALGGSAVLLDVTVVDVKTVPVEGVWF